MDHDVSKSVPFRRNTSGTMAVEFALLAPLFILLFMGIVAFSVAFSIVSGVQQLASEAARASIAGLSDTERSQIVHDFVVSHVSAYPFVVPQQLTVATATTAAPSAAFQVSLTYDFSRQAAVFASLLPFLPGQIHRSAVVSVSTDL